MRKLRFIDKLVFEINKLYIHYVLYSTFGEFNSHLLDISVRADINNPDPDDYYMGLIRYRGFILGDVPKRFQTVEMCIHAMEHDVGCFTFIKIHSEELYRRMVFGLDNQYNTICILKFGQKEFITFDLLKSVFKLNNYFKNSIDLDKYILTDDEKEYLRLL